MNDDADLLRRFAEENSEAAFTALVERHVNLVYGAALRRTNGDAHRAADVAQEVFTALARQAGKLSRHTVLSAWLHTATRNIAINVMISEQRRKARELAAMALETAQAGAPAPEWEQVRPALDAAIDELPEGDRAAVVLRFLERRPFAEIGAKLDISADAARMRTERAIEKLRAQLAQRGITSTASALGALVSVHSAVAAPAGLAATLASAALGSATAGAGALAASGTFLVSTKAIISGVAVVATLGLGFYLGLSHSVSQPLPPRPETPHQVEALAALRRENASLRAEIDRLATANAALNTPARPATAVTPPTTAPGAVPPLTRINQQRAMMNNLRLLNAAADQFMLENKRPPASLDELVGETKYVRALNSVAGEKYDGLPLNTKAPLTVTSPAGVSVTYDPTPNGTLTTNLDDAARLAQAEAQHALTQRFGADFVQRVTTSAQKAAAGYAAANNGKSPKSLEAVLPYFATPQEGADFVELAEMAKGLGLKF